MTRFSEFASQVLADRKITDDETPKVRELLYADGAPTMDDVRLLTELYCGGNGHADSFQTLYFSVLEQVFLADGEIQPAEQFYLLKMLYSDREVTENERKFLRRLRGMLRKTTSEFESLFETAMMTQDTGWAVGGRA